ncbi:unnamed protein product [Ectocarpus sp. CCAP 1310/34]|nr:unnamed protein product [Ectocarpus sp. CCAP 1310/34]
MVEEVRNAPLPILHHMIDIWADKPSGRKFLGVHVFYVTANFELKQTLLSIKRYRPSQDALGEAKAAEVLLEILEAILHEFGRRPSDLASGTTDSGSDVKSVSVNGLHPKYGVLWNWCYCHLMIKAAEDAFGTHPDPQKSKNPEAHNMLKNLIGIVGTLHKSLNLTAKFEDLQVDLLGEVLKIPNQAPQRWLTLVRTMERVIRLWHVLRKLYSDAGKNFILEEGDNKDCIPQLYSLLQSLSSVTRDGQYGGLPMLADIYIKFGMLKMGVLNSSADLKVFDIPPLGEDGLPDRKEQKKPLRHKMVAHDELHPVAQKARDKLCRALVSRFYGHVWDDSCLDPSMFCDAACLLTPPFSEGNYLSAMKLTAEEDDNLAAVSTVVAPTSDEDVREKLEGIWAEIKKRAVTAVKTEQNRVAGEGGGQGSDPFKRARTSGAVPSRRKNYEDDFSMFGCNEVAPSQSDGGDVDFVEEEVSGEIIRYKGVFMKPIDLPPSDVLAYWNKVGKQMFPSLKYVAQQTFGSQASAAQIERDFSHCGLFSTGNRSRAEEYWLEMVMVLKGNYELIPDYKDIPSIDSKDIRKCLPAKYSVGGLQLVVIVIGKADRGGAREHRGGGGS